MQLTAIVWILNVPRRPVFSKPELYSQHPCQVAATLDPKGSDIVSLDMCTHMHTQNKALWKKSRFGNSVPLSFCLFVIIKGEAGSMTCALP